MTVQPGLCRTWSEPKLLVFSRTGSFVLYYFEQLLRSESEMCINCVIKRSNEADIVLRYNLMIHVYVIVPGSEVIKNFMFNSGRRIYPAHK